MGPSARNDAGASEDLHRLSAVVIALQREAQTQGPKSILPDGEDDAKTAKAPQSLEPSVPRPRSIAPTAATGFTLDF